MNRVFRSRIYFALFSLLFIFVAGIFGYRFMAGYSWVDAVYMTVITVTTVGFGEVAPMDHGIKIFTSVLILCSVFIFAYSITVITEFLVAKNSMFNIKYRKMKNRIEHMKGHVIVCGYGNNGKEAVSKLMSHRRDCVVIEKNEEICAGISDDILHLVGDATEDKLLIEAGIKNASFLIASLPVDSQNLFITLSAKQLNPQLYVISRASQESTVNKLKLAGANSTVMPDKIGGDHMASMVVSPDLVHFLESLSNNITDPTNLEEISIEDLPDSFIDKSISEINLRKLTGCTVIGYKRNNGAFVVNPDEHTKLEAKSKLMVLGRPEQIKKLNEMFGIQ